MLGASKKLLILKILLYEKAKIMSSLHSIALMKVFVKSNFTVLEVTISCNNSKKFIICMLAELFPYQCWVCIIGFIGNVLIDKGNTLTFCVPC